MLRSATITAAPRTDVAALRPASVRARNQQQRIRPRALLSFGWQKSREKTELVDRLFDLCEGTDGGARASKAAVEEIEGIIQTLEDKFGCKNALKDSNVFGNFEVAYTSNPTAAGGPFRSQLGRAIFKTDEGSLTQTLDRDGAVENGVEFKIFGVFPGKVSLEGEIVPKGPCSFDIEFNPPQILLGSGDPIEFGSSTTVPLLTITYLDKRVRLARGNRGSRFVFKRI